MDNPNVISPHNGTLFSRHLARLCKAGVNALAEALKHINNANDRGTCQVLIRPHSRVIFQLLIAMMRPDYMEITDDHGAGKIAAKLTDLYH